mmetsp:Transcript_31104/g.61596  ORF Transcript_31104/g.61596 Transcript_31104/m.61596 type:complete len:414 (-) Transcript_31104:891-2132(-)
MDQCQHAGVVSVRQVRRVPFRPTDRHRSAEKLRVDHTRDRARRGAAPGRLSAPRRRPDVAARDCRRPRRRGVRVRGTRRPAGRSDGRHRRPRCGSRGRGRQVGGPRRGPVPAAPGPGVGPLAGREDEAPFFRPRQRRNRRTVPRGRRGGRGHPPRGSDGGAVRRLRGERGLGALVHGRGGLLRASACGGGRGVDHEPTHLPPRTCAGRDPRRRGRGGRRRCGSPRPLPHRGQSRVRHRTRLLAGRSASRVANHRPAGARVGPRRYPHPRPRHQRDADAAGARDGLGPFPRFAVVVVGREPPPLHGGRALPPRAVLHRRPRGRGRDGAARRLLLGTARRIRGREAASHLRAVACRADRALLPGRDARRRPAPTTDALQHRQGGGDRPGTSGRIHLRWSGGRGGPGMAGPPGRFH